VSDAFFFFVVVLLFLSHNSSLVLSVLRLLRK